ncbi:MAG: hypothetical protein ACTSWZ_07740 [Candidatus Heimdallarchaeaceae archaeon]
MFERIISFFRPKERKVYVLKVTPEILRQVPAALRKELGEKEAIIVKQSREIEKLKKEIEKLKGKETEEEKLVKELLKKKFLIEKAKALRRTAFIIPKKTIKVVTFDNKFYHDGKRTYPYFYGIEFEERKDSVPGINILVMSKDKKIGRILFGGSIEELFVDAENLVSCLKTGFVKLRIDSNGNWHPPEEIKENPTKRILSLKKKYETKIGELITHISRLQNELKYSKMREEKLRMKIKDMENAVSISNFRADMSQSFTKASLEQMKGMMTDYLQVLLSAQTAQVNKELSERLNETLVEAFKEMKRKLGVRISKEEEEYMREKILSEMRDILDHYHAITPKRVEITKEEKEVKKEEIKK